MLNFFRLDYARVYSVLKMYNEKIPTWAILLYYLIMLPIGLLLVVPAIIWQWYILKKILK